MKKILAILLAAMMLLSVVACGNGNNDTPDTPDTPADPETPVDDALVEPDVDKETLGYVYFEKFVEIKKADPTKSAETIVNEIMATKLGTIIQMPMVQPVEPGYLTGFNYENEFGGFEQGAMFGAGMMGVAFIGYVFDLAEGADIEAFIKSVEENVDPRWNGCTEAETVTVGAYEDSVLLVMCQREIPASISGKFNVVEPTVEAGSASETVWNEFKTFMAADNAYAPAVDIANALAASAFPGTVTEAEWSIDHEIFKYGLDDYNNAAYIEADGKTVYVIQLDEGMEIENWTNYVFDGIEAPFGAYHMTILLMVNVD